MDTVEDERQHRDAAIDTVAAVIDSYLDEASEVDSDDLAENIVLELERRGFVR